MVMGELLPLLWYSISSSVKQGWQSCQPQSAVVRIKWTNILNALRTHLVYGKLDKRVAPKKNMKNYLSAGESLRRGSDDEVD